MSRGMRMGVGFRVPGPQRLAKIKTHFGELWQSRTSPKWVLIHPQIPEGWV